VDGLFIAGGRFDVVYYTKGARDAVRREVLQTVGWVSICAGWNVRAG
jgi:hypothetical protein